MKGAPDVLIERCSRYVNDAGVIAPLNPDMKLRLEQLKDAYSSQGKRCLFLARKVINEGNIQAQPGSTEYERSILENAKNGLTLAGLVAIVDPLRPEISGVVTTLRRAGVRIAMVTICPCRLSSEEIDN